MKRPPLLADYALESLSSQRNIGPKQMRARQLEVLSIAKKFVLDPQAAQFLGDAIAKMPRLIADAQDFAILPFEKMWIELPARTFYRAVTGQMPALDSDEIVGYLFDGNKVTVYAGSYDGKSVGFLPIEYHLHKPFTLEQEVALASVLGISRISLDAFYWGSSAASFIDSLKIPAGSDASIVDRVLASQLKVTDLEAISVQAKESLRALRSTHSFRLAQMSNEQGVMLDPTMIFSSVQQSSSGDLRNIIALLLFINRTQDIQYAKDFSRQPAMINRKPRQLAPHRVISLKLDPTPRLMKLCFMGSGDHRRLHDVRGHYKHDKQARKGCQHGQEYQGDFGEFWEEYEPLRWRCTRCKGKRWWQPAHSRGSLDEGVVGASYAVTR